jgi:hypothetical protein
MVKWALRKENPRNFSTIIRREQEKGLFMVDVTDKENRFINWLDLKLKVLLPSKTSQTITLDQVAPGGYQGPFPAHEVGEYYLTLFGEDKAHSLESQTYGYGIPYTPEYEKMEINNRFFKKLSSITGGEVMQLEDDPRPLFRSAPGMKEYGEELWRLVVVASLLILISDVAVRKFLRLRRKNPNRESKALD